MRKKIVYIAHPIRGDVSKNLQSIIAILKRIYANEQYVNVVPTVPYYADVLALSDDDAAQRARGISNGIELIKRKLVDEVWLFGSSITEGMMAEVTAAFEAKVKVIATNTTLWAQLQEMERVWMEG